MGFFDRSKENFLKVSCGLCDGVAIGPFGYHPGVFPALHLQQFCLTGRTVALLIASFRTTTESLTCMSEGLTYLLLCIPFHLHFLPKIPLEEFFEVMLTKNYSGTCDQDTSDLLE